MYSPALFLASLISNYESETTRWAVASSGQIASPAPSLLFSLFCTPRAFLEFSRLSSKDSQAVTCLPDPLLPLLTPFLLSGLWRCPGRILRFATFVRSYLPSIRDFSSYPQPSSPFPLPPSPLRMCGREKCVMYLWSIFIFHRCAREL